MPTKISQMNAMTSPADDDLMEVVDVSVPENKQVKVTDLFDGRAPEVHTNFAASAAGSVDADVPATPIVDIVINRMDIDTTTVHGFLRVFDDAGNFQDDAGDYDWYINVEEASGDADASLSETSAGTGIDSRLKFADSIHDSGKASAALRIRLGRPREASVFTTFAIEGTYMKETGDTAYVRGAGSYTTADATPTVRLLAWNGNFDTIKGYVLGYNF